MVICRLSSLLGERRLKVADVVRDTGIARATVDRYYYDTVQSYDREVLDKLCAYLKVDLPALLRYVRHPDLFDNLDTAASPPSQYVAATASPLLTVQEPTTTYISRKEKSPPRKTAPRAKPAPKRPARKSR